MLGRSGSDCVLPRLLDAPRTLRLPLSRGDAKSRLADQVQRRPFHLFASGVPAHYLPLGGDGRRCVKKSFLGVLPLARSPAPLHATSGVFSYASRTEGLFAGLEYVPVILAVLLFAAFPLHKLLPPAHEATAASVAAVDEKPEEGLQPGVSNMSSPTLVRPGSGEVHETK